MGIKTVTEAFKASLRARKINRKARRLFKQEGNSLMLREVLDINTIDLLHEKYGLFVRIDCITGVTLIAKEHITLTHMRRELRKANLPSIYCK